MKKTEILKATNEIVAEYMSRGYLINFGDSSYGYDFRVDMVKQGEDPIRVCVKTGYVSQPHYMDTLEIVVLYTDMGWEKKDVEPISVRTFYKLSESWFTESANEALAAYEIQYKRYGYGRRERKPVDITPTEDFLRVIRRRRGFEDATLKRLKIVKSENRYTVTLLNRVGNEKARYVSRLNGKGCVR